MRSLGELLRMEHISKRFGSFYANKDITLTVNRGEGSPSGAPPGR